MKTLIEQEKEKLKDFVSLNLDCVVQFEKNEFVTKEGKGSNPVWNHGAVLYFFSNFFFLCFISFFFSFFYSFVLLFFSSILFFNSSINNLHTYFCSKVMFQEGIAI